MIGSAGVSAPSTDHGAFDLLVHRGESGPRTRSGIMALEILDSTLDRDRLRARFDNASRKVLRLRQRAVIPTLPAAPPMPVPQDLRPNDLMREDIPQLPGAIGGGILDSVSGRLRLVGRMAGSPGAAQFGAFDYDIYIAGAKVLRQCGIGSLPGVALIVVLISRGGYATITARYDRAAIAHADMFAKCLRRGFDEGLALAPGPCEPAVPASFPDHQDKSITATSGSAAYS